MEKHVLSPELAKNSCKECEKLKKENGGDSESLEILCSDCLINKLKSFSFPKLI